MENDGKNRMTSSNYVFFLLQSSVYSLSKYLLEDKGRKWANPQTDRLSLPYFQLHKSGYGVSSDPKYVDGDKILKEKKVYR